MKKIILLLTLVLNLLLMANPFDRVNLAFIDSIKKVQTINRIAHSKKYFYAKRAALRGNANAQFDLALMYARGTEGLAKNEKKAFKWFHKAARKNHVEAKFYMGLSFLQGRGVAQQKELAEYWLKLAARAGHAKATFFLAKLKIRQAKGKRKVYYSLNMK